MFLVLVLVAKYLLLSFNAQVATQDEIDECFDEAKQYYIACDPVNERPSKCDCADRDPCYISLNITREKKLEENKFEYLVNEERGQGPTIIANYGTLVVVDVFNNMSENTSIHWHGMHQYGFPWMDGVGYITQYPITSYGRFRYIFEAIPQGTHWYHSHMQFQRESGLLGALIVREKAEESLLFDVNDIPEQYTLVLQDTKTSTNQRKESQYCLPDGSPVPVPFGKISLFLNGKKLSGRTLYSSTNLRPSYFVEPGKKYRFRVLSAMSSDLISISIEDHRMHVVATDGYLVETFPTDYLIMHVSERYDFIVEAKETANQSKKYPIRVQTLARSCKSPTDIAGTGYAYLVYKDSNNHQVNAKDILYRRERDAVKNYTVLNCPVQNLPESYFGEGTTTHCNDVTVLKLLYPAKQSEVPSRDAAEEAFFDFRVGSSALINGIKFEPPSSPLVNNTKSETKNCHYPLKCDDTGSKKCTHAFYFGEEKEGKTVRFVLSALAEDGSPTSRKTHPIHMHGHSYFVAKVGYPTYNNQGHIDERNPDVNVPLCGNGSWAGQAPSDISVNNKTVRKDVVIVPAGGYVVIYFVADNPGYWFMHCHIDAHLNRGMAIALGEDISCASEPPDLLMNPHATNFCITIKEYQELKSKKKCLINEEGENSSDGKNSEKHMESQEEEYYKSWRKLFQSLSKSL